MPLAEEIDVDPIKLVVGDGTEGGKNPPEKRSKAVEFLIKYLRHGPRPAKDLREDAAQYGHSWATMRRAADELGVIRRGGPGSTWALPDELIAELDAEEGDEDA